MNPTVSQSDAIVSTQAIGQMEFVQTADVTPEAEYAAWFLSNTQEAA